MKTLIIKESSVENIFKKINIAANDTDNEYNIVVQKYDNFIFMLKYNISPICLYKLLMIDPMLVNEYKYSRRKLNIKKAT